MAVLLGMLAGALLVFGAALASVWVQELRATRAERARDQRFTPTGDQVCNLRVAVTARAPDGQGGWRDGTTSFFRVTVWRAQAEHAAESLTKGARVLVCGRLRQRSWETDNGERRQMVEIDADEVAASLKFHTATLTKATTRA